MKNTNPAEFAISLVGIIFAVIGSMFTGTTVLMGVLFGKTGSGTGNVRFLLFVFGFLGLIFLTIGILMIYLCAKKKTKRRAVEEEGYCVYAEVVNIQENRNVSINGRHPYTVECHYSDPYSGQLHVYFSDMLQYYPAELLGKTVRVYTRRNDDSIYVVKI